MKKTTIFLSISLILSLACLSLIISFYVLLFQTLGSTSMYDAIKKDLWILPTYVLLGLIAKAIILSNIYCHSNYMSKKENIWYIILTIFSAMIFIEIPVLIIISILLLYKRNDNEIKSNLIWKTNDRKNITIILLMLVLIASISIILSWSLLTFVPQSFMSMMFLYPTFSLPFCLLFIACFLVIEKRKIIFERKTKINKIENTQNA